MLVDAGPLMALLDKRHRDVPMDAADDCHFLLPTVNRIEANAKKIPLSAAKPSFRPHPVAAVAGGFRLCRV